jgi:hypothetical protein
MAKVLEGLAEPFEQYLLTGVELEGELVIAGHERIDIAEIEGERSPLPGDHHKVGRLDGEATGAALLDCPVLIEVLKAARIGDHG